MFGEEIEHKIKIFKKFEENLKISEKIKKKKNDDLKTQCDLSDPLSYLLPI